MRSAVGLHRAQRLRQRREITAVYRRGRPHRSKLVTVWALRTNLPVVRLGFAVGGSVGKAVERNRVRRRLREIAASAGVATGWDLMISARAGARGRTFEELREALSGVLSRAGVLERRSANR